MIAPLLLGMMGSVHCVGMCGPLMLSVTHHSGKYTVQSFLLYHMGRLSVYTLIGLFFGAITLSVSYFAFQQYFSILLGAIIILIFAIPKLRIRIEQYYFQSQLYRTLKKRLVGYYSTRLKWLAAGLMNGILPCGLVYLAAAGAALSTSLFGSISFMILFGLGTIPSLIVLLVLRNRISASKWNMPNLTNITGIITGGLLLARGLMVSFPDGEDILRFQVRNVMTICGL